VIHCLRNSCSFVDVTNAENPTVLAWLAGTRSSSGALQSASWRDVKVYEHYVYIGADSITNHGIQVYDLKKLRKFYDRTGSIVPTVEPDDVYTYQASGLGKSHNIIINEESGFLYAVGSSSFRGGPHILDLKETPQEPKFIAGFNQDGYTHDAQAVIYRGPDVKYQGKEIYFGYNEDTLTILDVSDKDNIQIISRVDYVDNYYTHQGWLTEDQTHLLMNDELDEQRSTNEKRTRTLQWNVENLEDPKLIGTHIAQDIYSIDHNLYIKENKAYMSNYCSGLRILDVTNIAQAETPEVAYFDMAPYCDTTTVGGNIFSGTWSNYPYFSSGTVVVNSIEMGLFVLGLQEPVKAGNYTRRA